MSELLYKEEAFKLVGFCMEIHRELGKGHDEIVYKDALRIELKWQGQACSGRILTSSLLERSQRDDLPPSPPQKVEERAGERRRSKKRRGFKAGAFSQWSCSQRASRPSPNPLPARSSRGEGNISRLQNLNGWWQRQHQDAPAFSREQEYSLSYKRVVL